MAETKTQAAEPKKSGWMTKLFGFDPSTMKVSTEIVAGITTFLAMSYILAVNPSILADCGMDKNALFTTTAVASILATLVMAFYAKQLLGTPYVAHTLEGDREWLTIDIDELDCTTFVENVLAMYLCVKNGKHRFADFCDYIRQVRYDKGLVSYPSRLSGSAFRAGRALFRLSCFACSMHSL